MMKYVSKGTIAAVLTVAAMAAGLWQKPALAAWLNDPATADAIVAAIVAVGALISGILEGVKKDDGNA